MRQSVRRPVNKSRSAGEFKRNVGRTKVMNLRTPMRGGFRL